MRMKGEVALVTGSTSELGKRTVECFVESATEFSAAVVSRQASKGVYG